MSIPFGLCALGCGCTILKGSLCDQCSDELTTELSHFDALAMCPACGARLLHPDVVCDHGGHASPVLRSGSYRGMLRRLLIMYKKSGDRRLAHPIARIIHQTLDNRLCSDARRIVLIPVPCSKRSLRQRGWDHVMLIASVLRRTYGYRALPLIRRCGGREQKLLDRRQRMAAVATSFAIASGVDKPSIDDVVVVLDDIMTTGSTISRCIELVKKDLGREIYGLCVAVH